LAKEMGFSRQMPGASLPSEEKERELAEIAERKSFGRRYLGGLMLDCWIAWGEEGKKRKKAGNVGLMRKKTIGFIAT